MIDRYDEVIESYRVIRSGDWEAVMEKWYDYLENLGTFGTRDNPKKANIFTADFSDAWDGTGVDIEYMHGPCALIDTEKHLKKAFGKRNIKDTTWKKEEDM